MSIEINLHPVRGSRRELRELLEELGYRPCNHLWKWPRGTLNYHWFDPKEHRSYDGVEANIARPDEKEFERLGRCSWMLHTRTRVWASPDDQEHQNKTIREARRRFGGNFYNDWYGVNRYTCIEPDGRDAISRGIYLVYERVKDNLKAVTYSLPEGSVISNKKPKNESEKKIFDLMGSVDPVRVLYNALVPFAVASLEHFFSQTFKIFVAYDDNTKQKLRQQTRKIEMTDLLAVREGSKSIEDIVAGWYSFQNIDSIHKAFSEWFSIDIWNMLRSSKVPNDNLTVLADALNGIIEFRHGIIHRYEIDRHLDRKQILVILETSIAIIEVFTEHVERLRGFPVRQTYEPEPESDDASPLSDSH
jgi:hypothetical protein